MTQTLFLSFSPSFPLYFSPLSLSLSLSLFLSLSLLSISFSFCLCIYLLSIYLYLSIFSICLSFTLFISLDLSSLSVVLLYHLKECEADPSTKSGEGSEQLAKCRAGLIDYQVIFIYYQVKDRSC